MTQEEVLHQLESDRRFLHQYPQEGWTEFVATYYVAQRLTKLGVPFVAGKKNFDLSFVMGRDAEKVAKAQEASIAFGVLPEFIDSLEGYPGIVAEIDTGRPGPVTACRFDMDCVCVEESHESNHIPRAQGFASRFPGLMHACGHDAHVAVGLATVQWVLDHREELTGKIRFLFQPAEEGTRGALPMVRAGLLDGVDTVIAGHIGGRSPLGTIDIITGGLFATSKINVRFTGCASHAGADPEKGRSALLAAAAASLMIAGISRHSAGDSRISIGTLRAGEGRNVTPVHAKLELETRGITREVNSFMEDSVRQIVQGVANSYGVRVRVRIVGKARTAPVCQALIERARRIAESIPTVNAVRQESRNSGSEDFTFFMNEVVDHGGQALFFFYGANHQGHHKSNFDVQTQAMANGYAMFTRLLADLHGAEA